ncbi:peptidase [Grimontia kaedaensis]|uniref:Peptidase n=1 Tax=Grimontia kaedaensis TaxID=2872157 RepID=A0ABY4WY72_9GAMM|nr:M14 family zinc carboxypeptidase [Grimontia kaedaensis]USH03932.1 peptidase [Grimontia kaedaensis]
MKKQYFCYRQTQEFLEQAAASHPELIQLQSIGETHEGRPILLATLSQNVAFSHLKPALLYTGTVHAREWIGNELAVAFIQYVLDNYQTNPDVIDALSRNTLYMVPCLNPDGFEYSHNHFSFWRKNRRDNGDGTFGVDLNRNFDVNFRQSVQTNSNVYGGPNAFSEPETQAIKRFVEAHNNIRIALDYHSQGNVFFPAHKFNHEAEIEGTDLNILCANMAQEIFKVTKRRYGIHRGKPPANLIHGSGREWYYSRGILATVVEVGSRNIPDYLINMTQSVDENIPALLYAWRNAINYSHLAPSRPEQFTVRRVGSSYAELLWQSTENEHNCYYQIFRSESQKAPCGNENLIGITSQTEFTDKQLKPGKSYYYNLRKVDKLNKISSPFAPELRIKTALDKADCSFTLFPTPDKVGYVGEQTKNNRDHFGNNSLFVGVNSTKGICYGVIDYDLSRLPEDADIAAAEFSLYPMNRVGAKIENYGEWSVSILDPEAVTDITSFEQIHHAPVIQTLGDTIDSDRLTQGIWNSWSFSGVEKRLFEQLLTRGRLLLRIQGPSQLPIGNDSQMMQFDIGYGRFGGGIHYRPSLYVIYQRKPSTLQLAASHCHTFECDGINHQRLATGYDALGQPEIGQMVFKLPKMVDENEFVVTEASVVLEVESSQSVESSMRFCVGIIDTNPDNDVLPEMLEELEYVGYEVSSQDLARHHTQTFLFDSSARQLLEEMYFDEREIRLVIMPTSESNPIDSRVIWKTALSGESMSPKLVLTYVERRKTALPGPTDLTAHVEDGVVKLSWTNPNDPAWVGCYVVRNSFHPPRNFFDGVKLYAGKDNYTYDRFGNSNKAKYYSVFSYDDVPNYSTPTTLSFSSDEVTEVFFQEFEAQDEVEQRYRDGD